MSFPKMLDELDVVETIALHHQTRPDKDGYGERYLVTCKACRRLLVNHGVGCHSLRHEANRLITEHMRTSPQCIVFKLRERHTNKPHSYDRTTPE